MPEFKGTCLCGKIRYQASADPVFMAVCHCKDCQRATGSAFEAVIGIPAAALTVQGTPKYSPRRAAAARTCTAASARIAARA